MALNLKLYESVTKSLDTIHAEGISGDLEI
jgi:hypothetical protein